MCSAETPMEEEGNESIRAQSDGEGELTDTRWEDCEGFWLVNLAFPPLDFLEGLRPDGDALDDEL